MNFNVRAICNSALQEMSVDEINTGTLDQGEALQLAHDMICAAEEILHIAGYDQLSDCCSGVCESLSSLILESQ